MKSRLTIIIYLKFFLKLRIIEQACIVMQIDFHSNSNEPSAVYCGIYRKHVIMQNDVSNQDETRIGYRKLGFETHNPQCVAGCCRLLPTVASIFFATEEDSIIS